MLDPNPLPLPGTSQQIPGTSQQIHVRSHGRIHFGLMEISEFEPNCYGGIGLMVEHSIADVQATILPTSPLSLCRIHADAHWHPRIEAVANRWLQTHPQLPVDSIRVIESPLPHQGLGSGTQMACTVAALLSAAERFQLDDLASSETSKLDVSIPRLFDIDALAKLSQRGKRSNIGLCGFMAGGFVADHGISVSREGGNTSSRTQSVPFPNWPVLILQDTNSLGDSGNDEASLFERCSCCPNPNRGAMALLVQQEILPAIHASDWKRFDIALGQYGRWAGQIFQPVQGGIYRTSRIAHSVEAATRLGLQGATQSSWGPTVCAFAQDQEHADWCQSRLQSELPGVDVSVTKAANYPAQVKTT